MKKSYNKVLIDIDNTITDLQVVLDIMASATSKPRITVDDVYDFQLSNVFGLSKHDDIRFWLHHEETIVNESRYAKQRVESILSTFTNTSTEIYYVTMRPQTMYHSTKSWLERHQLTYHDLIFTGAGGDPRSKIEIANDLGIQAIFEDNPALFLELKNHPLNGQFDMYIVDYPFNKHIKQATRLDRQTGLIIPN